MAYKQNDPLENLDSKNNQKKYDYTKYKTHGKDSAFYANYKNWLGGESPMVLSTGDYIGRLKDDYYKSKNDTIHYRDVTGQWHRKIQKGARPPFHIGEILEHKKIDGPPNKKKKKGGM